MMKMMRRCARSPLLLVLLLAVQSCSSTVATKQQPQETDRIEGAIWGALIADAMCWGSHFEQNTTKIVATFQDESQLYPTKVRNNKHHPRTEQGDLTDYGEYNIYWLEQLASSGAAPTELNEDLLSVWKKRVFGGRWKQRNDPDTQYTLRQLMHGMLYTHAEFGSSSNVMALRSVPLLGVTASEVDIVQYAKIALFTQLEKEPHVAQEFLTRVAFRLVHPTSEEENKPLVSIIESVADDMDNDFIFKMVDSAIEKVNEVKNPKSNLGQLKEKKEEEYVIDELAVCTMGKTWHGKPLEKGKCSISKESATENALPAALYFMIRYEEDDIIKAFIANTKVGGDNGSRAVAIGMVLGARSTGSIIPDEYKKALNHYEHIQELLPQLPLLKGLSLPKAEKGGSSGKQDDEL